MPDAEAPAATPEAQGGTPNLSRGAFTQVPIEIVISVGRARPMVRDLLRLQRDSVLPLDRRVDDPVELYVGDKLIARGQLEELEGEQAGQMAVRLTEVADLSDGV
ncbi:FliM/FliN family flagellar motor C-terminal domain-containing protein [Pararhodobacter sp. SW119]|uniref:FliM/FliN family flagellar motor switch protein n=1 Tax=Pararhodobacter sp. SW119 TaxID=2780075 RepID=UPI001ADF181A|nr:FliM/FliN family flagellar motor C-terminal domain-containing protein [Pararhodobacter sp. SW119]